MNTDRIDFISAYCDRWCERCAYTARCSAFAAEAAIAMCGSVEEGRDDWNGSAKVAMISLERSEGAWRVIAQATGDDIPAALADQLGELRREVEQEFPDALLFIRPGFDEPGR